jgi:hypothetical protein
MSNARKLAAGNSTDYDDVGSNDVRRLHKRRSKLSGHNEYA